MNFFGFLFSLRAEIFMSSATSKRTRRIYLYEQVIIFLGSIKKAGGDVAIIISDGNKRNHFFFSLLDTINTQSWLTKNNVFLIVDYMRLLKNIRNNCTAKKT